jgi:hypothetical protein
MGAWFGGGPAFVSYNYPLPDTAELAAWVTVEGSAELEASGEPFGIVEKRHGEIGRYAHDFGAEVGRRIRALAEAAVAEVSVESEPVLPGTPLLAFALGEGRTVKEVASCPLRALPPATARLRAEMKSVLAELLRHPVRTIRGSASWDPAAGTPGGKLKLVMRVVNTGRERAEIAHPSTARGTPAFGLRLELVADKPLDQLKPDDRSFIEVLASEVRDLKTPSPGPLATLEPGQALDLELTIQRQIYLSPGRYNALIRYESGSKKASRKAAIAGVLQIVPPVLVVVSPGR